MMEALNWSKQIQMFKKNNIKKILAFFVSRIESNEDTRYNIPLKMFIDFCIIIDVCNVISKSQYIL